MTISEVCLIIIAATLVLFTLSMIILFIKLAKKVKALQVDIHKFTSEGCGVLAKMENFLQYDAHTVSKNTTELLGNLNSLSAGVNDKVNSLNFLFHPVDFLSSQFKGTSSSEQQTSLELRNSKSPAIPKILKWLVSSVVLFKTTKEFIKK
ncbi:MAG: DUF948 domain-containing protein [Chlamydiales bacterium]|nr:DUF948 domain-containing protein [Chlamydiales bacterium]